jgi:hypothetical protein
VSRVVPALAAVAVCLLSVTAASAARDPWKQLHRPLHLPKLALGEPCPTSSVRSRFGLADALGEEPPYAFPFPAATVTLGRARTRRDDSYAYRVRWLAPARFSGRVLVRGRRLDRVTSVRFSPTANGRGSGELELTFARAVRRQTRGPVWLILRSPGCYGFQVDGLTFSNTLLFQARL